ncbi:CHAP domain-containing protein [Dokdonia pacifica]|nr:CHAP domain-containing protein [Dokdonia pacifica]
MLAGGIFIFKNSHLNVTYEIGQEIDSFNNIPVYYNGNVGNIDGRQLTNDGYNLGLKYQCVEFVKRYYYEHLNHKMPDSYGHAKDFFNPSVKDGKINKQRNLLQYTNLSVSKPKVNDLVIYSGNIFNKFGHVAIVTKVLENEIEIIQQNPGPYNNSRETYKLIYSNNKWYIDNHRIIGWLRK